MLFYIYIIIVRLYIIFRKVFGLNLVYQYLKNYGQIHVAFARPTSLYYILKGKVIPRKMKLKLLQVLYNLNDTLWGHLLHEAA